MRIVIDDFLFFNELDVSVVAFSLADSLLKKYKKE